MSDERSNAKRWPGVAVVLFPLLLALYVAGYFLLGDFGSDAGNDYRVYRAWAVARAYEPLGFLESRIRRRTVMVAWRRIDSPDRSTVEYFIFEPSH